jgi:hypothetical protein
MTSLKLYDFLNTKQQKRIKKYTLIKKEDLFSLETGMRICLFNPSNFQFKYAGILLNYDDTFLIIKNMKNFKKVVPFDNFIVFAKKCSKNEKFKYILEALN